MREFEDLFEINLPKSYINHVLRYNGGYPEHPVYVNETDEYELSWFYSIKFGSESIQLSKVYSMLKDVLPEGMLPIFDGAGGVNFCINLLDEKIYKIPLDVGEIIPELVADSLDEILENLHPE